ncbi:MAG: two-component regulator propeller domain-containing protein, partial [Candidatus Neomarinimicrobiota bacterium]
MTKPLNLKKILIAFSLFAFAYGQSDFSFRNISVKDGLAESTVKVIYEDINGLIYLGTENGLDVYDGYEFNNYHMNLFDNNSILGNKVSTIAEDKNGKIWVGTELGVSTFDPETRTFSRPINKKDLNGNILEDPETIVHDLYGNVWIKLSETGRIYKYTATTQRTLCMNCNSNSKLDSLKITVLFKDRSNTIWLGSESGLFSYDPDLSSIIRYPLEIGMINSIANGHKNEIWVGTNNGLVWLTNGPNSNYKLYRRSNSKSSIVSNYIKDLAWDKSRNMLWIATDNGISRYIPSEDKFFNIQTTPYADSIVENDISE